MQISEYLSKNDIPAAQFARRIGVLKQTFFKYVHGIAFPPATVLKRIAEETKGDVTAIDFVEQHTPDALDACRLAPKTKNQEATP